MKKLCVLFVFVVLACILIPQTVEAGSAPVVGGTGNTLPEGYWYMEDHFIDYEFDQIYLNGWSKIPDGKKVFLSLDLFQLYYGVTDKFNLRLNLFYYLRMRNELTHKEVCHLLGEPILDAKYRLYYQKKDRYQFSFSMTPGVSFNLGDDRLKPFDSDNKTFVDFYNGYNLTLEYKPFTLHQYTIYWVKTSNVPNYMQYNVAVNLSVLPYLDLCAELNGKHWLGNLGHKRWLDFCPGLQLYPLGKTPCFEIALMFPVEGKGGLKYKDQPGLYAGFGYFWK